MDEKTPSSYRFQKVLLVDDNEIDNFINERILNSSFFAKEVIVKNSADAAMAFLKNNSGSTADLPRLIFLDLNMPVKDGFAFLDEYNSLGNELKKSCSIIVLSASISPEDINRASTNPYVIKYLNKPLSEKYLEAVNV
ncbi:MAG: response regulator [Bacteroidia bacterium]